MANINYKKLEDLLNKKEPIEINDNLIKKVLGFDDMRDFTSELYHWGYQTDFTYRDAYLNNWQRHFRMFLKSYLD